MCLKHKKNNLNISKLSKTVIKNLVSEFFENILILIKIEFEVTHSFNLIYFHLKCKCVLLKAIKISN